MRTRTWLTISLLLGCALAYGITRRSRDQLERTVFVAAPIETVMANVADLERWAIWCPWELPAAEAERRYAGTPGQPGHSSYWSSDRHGRGRMTVLTARPRRLEIEREVSGPRGYSTDIEIALAPVDGGTRISWTLTRERTIGAAWLDRGHHGSGAEIETALTRLKGVVEAEARAQSFRVERTALVPAAPSIVHAHLADLHNWPRWSPWKGAVTGHQAYGGPRAGTGSSHYWASQTERGRVTVTATRVDQVELELEVEQPRRFATDLVFRMVEEGGGTRVFGAASGKAEEAQAALYPSGDPERELGRSLEVALATLIRSVADHGHGVSRR